MSKYFKVDLDDRAKDDFDKFKRKSKVMSNIAKHSARAVLSDQTTYAWGVGAAITSVIFSNASVKSSVRSGVLTVGLIVGANVIQSLVQHSDAIKNS